MSMSGSTSRIEENQKIINETVKNLSTSSSLAEKVEFINQKSKLTLKISTSAFKESLLLFKAQTQNQHVEQQLDNIIKILDNQDTSRLKRLASNIKKILSSPNVNAGILQELDEFTNILVARLKLDEIIGKLGQGVKNLDEYFTKINKAIVVAKKSNDPNAIIALNGLIKPIEKCIKDKNSIQQLNDIKLILNQQNISPTDAKKLSKAMASLEQNIRNQYSIKLDNIIALLNEYEHRNQIQPDPKSQNIAQAKTDISIKRIIKEVKNLLHMLAQMLSNKLNNKKLNTKNAELGNTPINKKQKRASSDTKTNTRVSNIDNIIYDADKVITLESGAVYILDENNLVRAFQMPGKPIRFLSEQKGIEFNERLNKHMANRDLNNITNDQSAHQEHNQPASVDSKANDATPPPKSPRTYEYRVGSINDNHHVSQDSQAYTPPSHDCNNSDSSLQNVDSRKQEQQTSSLDHILKGDKGVAETAGINLQHKIHRPSRQLKQNGSRSSKFTSRRAFEAAKSKNNARSR